MYCLKYCFNQRTCLLNDTFLTLFNLYPDQLWIPALFCEILFKGHPLLREVLAQTLIDDLILRTPYLDYQCIRFCFASIFDQAKVWTFLRME